MKVSWLIILMSATYAYGASNIRTWEKAFERKCVSNGQSKDYFRLALNKTYNCIKSGYDPEPPHPILSHQKFCKYLVENQFYGCIKNFTTDLLPCLDKTETYLQRFMLNAIGSGYKEVCGPSGLSNLKYLEDKYNRTKECLAGAAFVYMYSGLCITDLTFFKNLDKGIMNLNKKNVCLDINSLQNCSTRFIERICENEDFSRFTDLIFQPFLEQCQEFSKTNPVIIK